MMKLVVRIQERLHNMNQEGQAMTEYAMILAAVAVIVYATYKTMGTTIVAMVSNIDTQL